MGTRAFKGVLKAPICSAEPLVFVHLKGTRVQCVFPLEKKAYRSPYRQLTGQPYSFACTYRSRTIGHESLRQVAPQFWEV